MGIGTGITTSIVAIGIGTFLMIRGGRDARIFALVAYTASAYVISLTLLFYTHNMIFSDLVVATGAGVIASATAFAMTFMRTPRAVSFIGLLPILIVMLLASSNLFIQGSTLDVKGSIKPIHGPLFPLLAITVTGYCIATWRLLLKTIRASSGIARAQARIVLLAFSILLTSVLLCNVLAPLVGFSAANMVTASGLVVFLGCVTYAFSVQALFDVQLLVYRGLIQAIIPAATLASIGIAVSITDVTGIVLSLSAWLVIVIIAAIIGSIIGQFALPAGSSYVQRLIYPNLRTGEQVRELVDDAITQVTTRSELVAAIRSLLVNLFHPERIVFTSNDEGEAVVVSGTKLEIRISGIGVFTMEGRRTGDLYGATDELLAQRALPGLEIAAIHIQTREVERDENEVASRRLLADIAHGLQTPLAVLRAECEGDAGLSDEIRGRIGRAADDLSGRLRSLIAYARGTVEPLEAEVPEVHLEEILNDVTEYVGVTAADSGVTMRFGAIESYKLEGKPSELETLITNLLSNAVEYARRGSGIHEVFISLKTTRNGALLIIADTGPGLSAEDKKRAFEPLYRGIHARSGSGMGLGLAIARQIARSHSADIDLQERPEGGTAAIVTFMQRAKNSELLQ